MLYLTTCLCHSTHKHTPEHPRLRLVIPLSHDISEAEYEPASQKLCNACALTPLQDKETGLIEEVQMLADAVEICIYENTHVAQDQNEYQKRYDSLSAKYDEIKAKLDAISEQISDKQARRASIEQFLKTLKKQNGLIDSFQQNLWCGMVDFMTVYSKDDIRVTFKNGMEIKA